MTRFLIVCHGETDCIRQGRWQGRLNVPLNATGRQQATALAARLAREHLAAVYSSPLRCAVETAQEIALRHKLNVCREERFKEINLGAWEGLGRKDIALRYPDLLATWEKDPLGVRPPQGESIAELEERVLAAIRDITLAYPGEAVCMVAHPVVNSIIRWRYADTPLGEALRATLGRGEYTEIDVPHPLWG